MRQRSRSVPDVRAAGYEIKAHAVSVHIARTDSGWTQAPFHDMDIDDEGLVLCALRHRKKLSDLPTGSSLCCVIQADIAVVSRS